MHLESTQEQDVSIEHADLDLHFSEAKPFTPRIVISSQTRAFERFSRDADFEIRGAWKDCRSWYTLTLACVRVAA